MKNRITFSSLSKTLANERLSFKNNEELKNINLSEENGNTRRKIQRIIEKRISQNYWKGRKGCHSLSNRERTIVRREVKISCRMLQGYRSYAA